MLNLKMNPGAYQTEISLNAKRYKPYKSKLLVMQQVELYIGTVRQSTSHLPAMIRNSDGGTNLHPNIHHRYTSVPSVNMYSSRTL